MSCPVLVLKFGGSVLRGPEDLPRAVHEIYRFWREGRPVIAVVSAFHGETDRLLTAAARFAESDDAARAALVATGEATSAAQLALALAQAGLPAALLDPAQAGLRTEGPPLSAHPVALDAAAVRAALARGIVVLPGFCGRDAAGATTLLGRGGSDATALFIAAELGAECRLIKDVEGLNTADPARDPEARPYARAGWETALRVGGRAVQRDALRGALARGTRFTIAAAGAAEGTLIGPGPDAFAPERTAAAPLTVALLGCGTVGLGVYRHLAAQPGRYEIAGVAVRDADKAVARGVPRHLVTRDARALARGGAAVVVELIGGFAPAAGLIEDALRRGAAVVTANKALLAERVDALQALAAANGGALRASAAVGGALPALEAAAAARRRGGLKRLSGVLNGTCNFILERLAQGEDFPQAVSAAQAAGYAEADPALDLDGSDAAQKLVLLARAAFGARLPFAKIARSGLYGLDPEAPARATRAGRALRLVAALEKTGRGARASVEPLELPGDHPFASLRGADNGLLLEFADGGREFIRARGAGRWPTAEAVFADLEDLRRARAAAGETDETTPLEAAS